MKKPTVVFAYKRGGYTFHGVRYPEGGLFETCDAGWSLTLGVKATVARLKQGTQYQIEKGGKLFPEVITKA